MNANIKTTILAFFKHGIRPKYALLAGAGVLSLLIFGFAISFFWPRSVTFSYSQSTCFANPTLLPNLIHKKQSATFRATATQKFTVAGYPVYSHSTCIVPVKPPVQTIPETVVLGTILKKNIRVLPDILPTLRRVTTLNNVSVKDPLVFQLSQADKVFQYQLQANNKKVLCTQKDRTLTCNVVGLGLAQSAQYDFVLQRLFKGKPAKIVLKQSAVTVKAAEIVASSIKPDQMIYDTPTELTLTLNKPVRSFANVRLYLMSGETKTEVPTTPSIKDGLLTVRFAGPLARSASFILSIGQITAQDGGYLNAAFSLPFKTSGGPKVVGINIATYKVQPTSSIVLSFDSNVSAAQATHEFVRLELNGSPVAAGATVRGQTVILTPQNALPRCAAFTVKVLDGLQNTAGVSGGSAWQFKSQTICQTAFSIGTSVQGRDITAYSFGSGAGKIIYVGGTHGNEKSSTYTLNAWMDSLEAQITRVPADRTIIVIPNLNPDGFAANTRTNAHGIDLNRNFPANNWKTGVTMPDLSYSPNGGGIAPLSEPESSALVNFVLSQSPRMVLTYHATAGVVMPNDAGDSVALARLYDQKSNVNFAGSDQTGTIFQYDTTGAFEDWLHDKPGISGLLIELWTIASNEFGRHQDAMWAMAQTP